MLQTEELGVWLSYIESELGLILPPIQQKRFETAISAHMNSAGLSSDAFFERIKRDPLERQALFDDLAINETQFFRHLPSYEALKSYLKSLSADFVRLWSLGCSTGEEAWSLAMSAEEAGLEYQVIGTDISSKALKSAEQAVYSKRKLHLLSEEQQARFFTPLTGFDADPKVEIKPFLRSKVAFFQHNLLQAGTLPVRNIDVIFCQNVLIYFRAFVQRDILNQLVGQLKQGGLLILGPSEARSWKHPNMERFDHAGALAYTRVQTQGDAA